MASTLFNHLSSSPYLLSLNHQTTTQIQTNTPQHTLTPLNKARDFTTKCTTPDSPFPSPSPDSIATTSPENFPLEKRRRPETLRERKSKRGLEKKEPPNYEVGWKRTKEINLEKPVGHVIMDFLEKFEGLMGMEFGSKELLAKVGEIVAERARGEAEALREEGKVEERMVTELFRVLRLMEMDLEMVKAAVKEETLSERVQQAKARCRQAILVANSF